ncbi:MAG: glycosyltransferase family 4 protein [Novosphingobium sp.]
MPIARAIPRHRITVCYPLAGDSLGGSHVSLLGLLCELDDGRYRKLVVPEFMGGKLSRHFADYEQIADPAAPRESFAPGRSFGLLKAARTLSGLGRRVRFLRENAVDIVHTNDGRSHATWALAAKLAGARLVWHHRGDPDARGLRYVAPWLADSIVTVSGFSLPRRRFGAARRARVVYSPFDVSITADRELCRTRIVDDLACSPESVICGFFGSFVERKRPLAFVEAIIQLRGRIDRPVIGVMFGEPKHEHMKVALDQRIGQPDVAGLVRLLGYRTPGHEWIAACDMLLVPAVNEPLGRTLVEAMLVRTPVIAADSGGNPEALQDGCGVLVPPDNPEAMAEAIVRLLDQPDARAAMIERAVMSAPLRFSGNSHGVAMEQVYSELVAAEAARTADAPPGRP